ncbi:MAG: HD domain-containing protein [Acidobacteria bacterium]|jgi:HD superfamily phosphohydrolase|nr:MAG: HD domain-containing protein [Acidobacteriota bacterium]
MFKEFSDPIHQFIKANSCEIRLIDSPYLQRLRFIKQLGITYLVFPSAQHSRFEHSLGTMELASRIYNSLGLKDEKLHSIYRLAGLLHDVGHTPFSHTTEVFLGDRSHENIGEKLLLEGELGNMLRGCGYSYEDLELLCSLSFRKDSGPLPKIITGEFGADRMDYLQRDAYFCGTSYGFFDYPRLLSHLQLVKGLKCVHMSALRALESFVLGRYFMYSQVYFHKVVRILNIHLRELMLNLTEKGLLQPHEVHRKTDADILSLIMNNLSEEDVRRLLGREHYRQVFSTHKRDDFEYVRGRILEKYEEELLRFDVAEKRVLDEDIYLWDGHELKSLKEVSSIVGSLKDIEIYRVYAHPNHVSEVREFVGHLS